MPFRFSFLLVALFALAGLSAVPAAAQFGSAGTDLLVRVFDQQTGGPVERARLEVGRFPAGSLAFLESDPQGRATFTNLTPGSYIVRARALGYEPAEARLEILRGDMSRTLDMSLARDTHQPATGGSAVSVREMSIPAAARAEFRKGQRELEKKAAARSLPFFLRAIELFPSYYEAHHGAGLAHVELGASAAAEASFRRSLELAAANETEYLPASWALAVLLMASQRHAEAEPLLRSSMRRDPRNFEWPFQLARCLLAQDRWGEALPYARLALTLAESSAAAPDAGAQTLATPSLASPYSSASPASAASSSPWRVHLLLADLYSGLGRDREAVAHLDAYLARLPDSPDAPRVRSAIATLKSRLP
jgi:tetratricopeptide (TPR) repeat protein